jgi:glycosyltransferase involved in cell wall biosynthesis
MVEAATSEKRTIHGRENETELDVRVETGIPSRLAVGGGNAVVLCGSCFHRRQRIRELRVGLPGSEAPAIAHGMPRPDLFTALHPRLELPLAAHIERDDGSEEDPYLMSYRSGFWVIASFEPVDEPVSTELRATARLEDGTVATASLGRIELDPGPGAGATAAGNGRAPGPLVAICMATYEPPLDLFQRQVESIRSQTHANWICMVSDDRSSPARFDNMQRILDGDPRFVVTRAPRRLGYYHNFERALSMTPPSAGYATLADQDDRWHPEKLETLLGALGDANLVYSDARVVDRDGRLLSNTYWSRRRNNHTNMASLLVANTVTGAASLFRRELLELALPFPPRHGSPYHDHWLALVALASGRIAYVDRPLYDYVQHQDAAIGHARANAAGSRSRGGVRGLLRLVGKPRSTLAAWRGIYFLEVCRVLQFATVLERRYGDRMSRTKRRAVRLLAASERSPRAMAWLLLRRARRLAGRNETLGVELALLRGIAWRYALALVARRELPPGRFGGDASMPPRAEERAEEPAARPVTTHSSTQALSEKVQPLELDIHTEAPQRVNLLVPTIDLEHFSGGYLAKLNLARRLADRGLRLRLVTVDHTPPLPRSWQRTVESYSGLSGLFDRLEVAFARNEGRLEVSTADRFIATTCWTAHLAHGALRSLDRERFLYLIQEYEPFTFPMGAFAALARQSYELPHFALFSTDLLRDYFRGSCLGVFSESAEAGKRTSATFANAITQVEPPSERELATRGTRRLLFDAHPESHEAQNMSELGILALERAVSEGALGPDWELNGVGTGEPIELGEGVVLEMLPRGGQVDYGELLKAHDAGLALMYTPHPSPVAIEMASAGMLTVTNSFENKTAEAMATISSNLLTVEPSIQGICTGLREAAAGIDDVGRRVRGSDVRWSRDWDDSFDDELIERVASFLEGC